MFVEIVKRTPPLVFVLFFVLLYLGYTQTKDRVVGWGKIAILPVCMIGLSVFGVISAFGIDHLVSLIGWLVGVSAAGMLSYIFPRPVGVSYSPVDNTYYIPGSWLPLFLMMFLYFTKYAVGVTLARQLPIIGDVAFIIAVSCCYGLVSGLFFFRAIVIWRSGKL